MDAVRIFSAEFLAKPKSHLILRVVERDWSRCGRRFWPDEVSQLSIQHPLAVRFKRSDAAEQRKPGVRSNPQRIPSCFHVMDARYGLRINRACSLKRI